jgi:hypothetical protein
MEASESSNWRDLCAAAAVEQDTAKLTRLVKQIIQAMDRTFPRARFSDEADSANQAS